MAKTIVHLNSPDFVKLVIKSIYKKLLAYLFIVIKKVEHLKDL